MRVIIAAVGGLALLAGACATPDAGPGQTADTTSTGEPTPTVEPGATSTRDGTPTPDPSSTPDDDPDELPQFDCSALPVEGDGTVDLANIADVRVGRHDGYDRVVFEFQAYESPDGDERDEGIPQHLLRPVDPPLRDTPRGAEMNVAGSAYLHLTLIGGTRLTGELEETYEGPLQFDVEGAIIAEAVEAGDFEATADWYIGLEADDPCLRVFDLGDPARLVIDVEHP